VYLKDNVCAKASEDFGGFLKRQCNLLVETGSPQVKQLIAETTERHNFIFFSIYRTDLSVSSFLPSYHFESVGVLIIFISTKPKNNKAIATSFFSHTASQMVKRRGEEKD
jgi:hypothetical protein